MQIIKASVLVLNTSVWPKNNFNLIIILTVFDRMFGKSSSYLVCVLSTVCRQLIRA